MRWPFMRCAICVCVGGLGVCVCVCLCLWLFDGAHETGQLFVVKVQWDATALACVSSMFQPKLLAAADQNFEMEDRSHSTAAITREVTAEDTPVQQH